MGGGEPQQQQAPNTGDPVEIEHNHTMHPHWFSPGAYGVYAAIITAMGLIVAAVIGYKKYRRGSGN